MSSATHTIYFIAGGTRGIGLALVGDIASKDPNAIVYAGGRNPSNAPKLLELAGRYPDRVLPVTYVAGDQEGNEALAKEIGKKWGRVDTVIANAAITNYFAKVHEAPIEKYLEHFSVNTLGPIVLFQSFRSLLQASAQPRFVAISSGGGSLALQEISPVDNSPYGASKAALNLVVRKIHIENEWLVAFPQCPGPVDTDMLRQAIAVDTAGKIEARLRDNFQLQKPEDAARILVDIITASTREKDGGQFHNIEGGRHPW